MKPEALIIRSNQQPKRFKRYTVAEMKALTKMVLDTRNLLELKNQMPLLMDKFVWVQLSNRMQAIGWPKRSWVWLRKKGRKILNLDSPTGHEVDKLENISVGASPMSSTRRSCDSSDCSSVTADSRPSPIRCELAETFPLPKLIPCSEACAYKSAVNSGPQILHVSSRAENFGATRPPPHLNSGVFSISVSEPVQAEERIAPPVLDRGSSRDLCAPSDKSQPLVQFPHQLHSGANKLSPTKSTSNSHMKTPQMTDSELQLKMEIYRKKLEILEVKKAYWTSKLMKLRAEFSQPNPLKRLPNTAF